MKNEKSKTYGVSLPEDVWQKIDAKTNGRHGGRSQFIADAVRRRLPVKKPTAQKEGK